MIKQINGKISILLAWDYKKLREAAENAFSLFLSRENKT